MIGSVEINMFNNVEHRAPPTEGKDLSSIQELSYFLENINSHATEKPDLALIECTSRTALIEQNAVARIEANANSSEKIPGSDSIATERLSNEDKTTIKEDTDWTNEIIENIQNMQQYEILKNAGLKEVYINGRICLIKENVDLDYTDVDGISNRDRIARGLAPLDSETGKPLELHHLGQKVDSPLVELTVEEHRTGEYVGGLKNQSLWHDNTLETEIHGEGSTWGLERKTHWKLRSEQSSGVNG